MNLIQSMKKYANPLQIRYWSTTPYLLGTNAIKYSAIPHVHARDEIPANPGDDFLREAMIRQLATGDALFDFTVQLQIGAETMRSKTPARHGMKPYRRSARWRPSVSPSRNSTATGNGNSASTCRIRRGTACRASPLRRH